MSLGFFCHAFEKTRRNYNTPREHDYLKAYDDDYPKLHIQKDNNEYNVSKR